MAFLATSITHAQTSAPNPTIIGGSTNGSPPTATTGVEGNFFLDSATGNYYGPKAFGQWPQTPGSIFTIGPVSTLTLTTELTRPYTILITGQSNAKGFGDGGDVGTIDANGLGNIDQTCGGIWGWDDFNNKWIPVQYGIYPFNDHPPGLTTWSPNIGVEAARDWRRRHILQCGRPIQVILVAASGKSISNWSKTFLDGNNNPVNPYGITLLASDLIGGNVSQVDETIMSQAEGDSIGTTPDLALNQDGTAQAWPTGNNPGGNPSLLYFNWITGPYTTQATIDAVTAANANGTNSLNGYVAAAQQAVTNWRSLPAMSKSLIVWNELHRCWGAIESQRNDAITTLPNLIWGVALNGTSGQQCSTLTTNSEHWNGPALNHIGASANTAWISLYNNRYSPPPIALSGAADLGGATLHIVNGIDGQGNQQSLDGTYYQISADQFRTGSYAFDVGTAIGLPPAGFVANENSSIECSSGSCSVYSIQPITNYPGNPTITTINVPWVTGGQVVNSYTIPAGLRIDFNSGRSNWAYTGSSAKPGLFRGALFNTSQNIGQNASTTILNTPMVTGNIITLAYISGATSGTVTATYDGTTITTSDGALTSLATQLKAIFPTNTIDDVPGQNAITSMGPAQISYNLAASSITGGASQPLVDFELNVYALLSRHIGQIWSVWPNTTYIMAAANANNPGDTELQATGGGTTAGPFKLSTWADSFLDRSYVGLIAGDWGTNPFIQIQTNQIAVLAPDANSRWVEKSGSGFTPPPGLSPGGLLGTTSSRLSLTADMVTGNILTITGTINGSSIATVTQPFFQSNSITIGLAAQKLQTALAAVLSNATASSVYLQDVIQINQTTGTVAALSGAITSGASQPTVNFDTGNISVSPTQYSSNWQLPVAGANIYLPLSNTIGRGRIGFDAQTATTQSTINAYSFSGSDRLLTRVGSLATQIIARPQETFVFENCDNARWCPTGGNYFDFGETLTAAMTSGGTTVMPSGDKDILAILTGTTITSQVITLPTAPDNMNSITINPQTAVATVTYNNAGASAIGLPTAFISGTPRQIQYRSSPAGWVAKN